MERTADLLTVAAVALVVTGTCLIYLPAGLIVAGLIAYFMASGLDVAPQLGRRRGP